MRDEALVALRGSELIIHAGDVGKPEILTALRQIAPVVAVKGNIDKGAWTSELPSTAIVEAGLVLVYVLHSIDDLDLNPAAAGFQIVVSGHSHKPSSATRSGVFYINPGSAGPRRFHLPVTVAHLDLAATPWDVTFTDIGASSN